MIKSQPNDNRFFPFSTFAAGAIVGVGVVAASICCGIDNALAQTKLLYVSPPLQCRADAEPAVMADGLPKDLCPHVCKMARRVLDRADSCSFCLDPICKSVEDKDFLGRKLEQKGKQVRNAK